VIEEWPADRFAAELASRDRVLVLFYASWCPFSRIFLPLFDKAEAEASVPFARADLRHPMDPRWDQHRVHTVPTLVYFEHGEELERLDGVRHKGLGKRDLDEMLALVESIQDEPVLPKRMHGPRRS
jgi:thioredoxin 1